MTHWIQDGHGVVSTKNAHSRNRQPRPRAPMFSIHPTARLRPSPFYESAQAAGMTSASIYNRMILPTSYGDPEGEYWRILNSVSMWDVGVQRQVQLSGPDALKLAQLLTVRDLSNCAVGQGKYAPICNHEGVLLNDPVVLKFSDELIWFSIADSDIWYWAKAIAAERGLRVSVSEPDVSPLAVQGPKAESVVSDLLGDWVKELKYFWFKETELAGIPLVVQRSGWSKQGGFELYLKDGSKGAELWNRVAEAGQPYGIGPGAPATPERVESGLVSVGGDTDDSTNPFEVRLGNFVNLDVPDEVVGVQALRKIVASGVQRHQLGVVLEGETAKPMGFAWESIEVDGQRVGAMTVCVFSPRLAKNIGYALVDASIKPGAQVCVRRADGPVSGILQELPFF